MANTHTHASGGDSDGVEAHADGEQDDDSEHDFDDQIEPELEALFGLAQIDAEALVAYEIVAQYVGARAVRDKLLEFAADHRRHVDEVGRYLAEQGVEAATAMPEPESSSFAALANALAAISDPAGLQALQANELFTNATYSSVLDLPLDSEARALVERNLADEQRHACWLADHQSSGWDDDRESDDAKS